LLANHAVIGCLLEGRQILPAEGLTKLCRLISGNESLFYSPVFYFDESLSPPPLIHRYGARIKSVLNERFAQVMCLSIRKEGHPEKMVFKMQCAFGIAPDLQRHVPAINHCRVVKRALVQRAFDNLVMLVCVRLPFK